MVTDAEPLETIPKKMFKAVDKIWTGCLAHH
jgi:hypothetical protein